ncbi:MAG: MBL fold metallo-hydrolase RNA specificity domain-containing protein, partial [Nitrososphaeraceae archaeon]
HCDYNELIQVVKKCNPKKVFTIHGFAHEFARVLNNMGYDATSLENHERKSSKRTKSHPSVNLKNSILLSQEKTNIKSLDYFV